MKLIILLLHLLLLMKCVLCDEFEDEKAKLTKIANDHSIIESPKTKRDQEFNKLLLEVINGKDLPSSTENFMKIYDARRNFEIYWERRNQFDNELNERKQNIEKRLNDPNVPKYIKVRLEVNKHLIENSLNNDDNAHKMALLKLLNKIGQSYEIVVPDPDANISIENIKILTLIYEILRDINIKQMNEAMHIVEVLSNDNEQLKKLAKKLQEALKNKDNDGDDDYDCDEFDLFCILFT